MPERGDYVTKPFRLEELLARARAQLRDASGVEPTLLEVGGISLDLRTRRVLAGGSPVDLTAREFTMLETFIRHAGQVLSREQHRYLRQKVGEEAIETVRGMGYRMRS